MTAWEFHLGDCLDGMRTLADKSVDHVITDPPYEAEAHTLQRRCKRGNGSRLEIEPIEYPAITEEERTVASAEVGRITRRWSLVFCQVEAASLWRAAIKSGGMRYMRTMVWVKPNGQPQLTGDRPGMGHETIVVCHSSSRSRWNGGGKHGVYTFLGLQEKAVRQGQKPLDLMEQLVTDFTDPGELICDPFAGAGTTGVAAIRLGRRFIGWEKDPATYEKALRRLESTREQPGLFDRPRAGRHKQEKLL